MVRYYKSSHKNNGTLKSTSLYDSNLFIFVSWFATYLFILPENGK